MLFLRNLKGPSWEPSCQNGQCQAAGKSISIGQILPKPIQLRTRQWFIQWILLLVLSFPWWCIRGYCDHVSTPKQECESLSYFRIHKFMHYFARDIVGISAYDFYHANDVTAIQGHHAKCKQPLWCLVFCSSASGPGNERSKGTLNAVYLK